MGPPLEGIMGKLDGKVAFVTGAARGQGRSHAILLAKEGADIIAVDICKQLRAVLYPMSTPEDLEQTVKEVESLGRRIVAHQADVRDATALQQAFDLGVGELGLVDIVVANAGIGPGGDATADQQWDDVVDVNLKGVWNTGRVAIPSMIKRGKGGAIVLTSSTAGLIGPGVGYPGMLAYVAAKHGVVGLMRSWANYLAPHFIRVNSVAPTTVRTPMAGGDGNIQEILEHSPDLAGSLLNAMPVDAIDPIDVSNAILWLVSEEARYVTGIVLPVDAGNVNRR
jgi:SDR family mycofactocin-dependent oxidoreductase